MDWPRLQSKVTALLLASCVGPPAVAGRAVGGVLLYEEGGSRVRSVIVLVERENLTAKKMTGLAATHLRRAGQQALTRVLLVDSRDAAVRLRFGKGTSHPSHALAKSEIHAVPPWGRVGEVLRIGASTFSRFTSGDGRWDTPWVASQGGLPFDSLGADLLWVDCGPGDSATLFFRIRQQFTEERARELLKKMVQLAPGIQISVAARRESWFIEDPRYPWINPFLAGRLFPTEVEFETSQSIVCSNREGGESCLTLGLMHPASPKKR